MKSYTTMKEEDRILPRDLATSSGGTSPIAPFLNQSKDQCLQDLHGASTKCANCGVSSSELLRCSRCKASWYCSLKCHAAYWPFHREFCRKNDFADALHQSEPSFAAWMRKHHKQAVLKDAEVDRLERASQAASGAVSRDEVMAQMYGKADPRPAAPSYTPQQLLAMQERNERARQEAMLLTDQDQEWLALPPILPGFGLSLKRYRWQQNMSHVDVHIKLPPKVAASQVSVDLQPERLHVFFEGRRYISGNLFKTIDTSCSTWFIDTGVMHISLLKRCRKGRYSLGILDQHPNKVAGALPGMPGPSSSRSTTSGSSAIVIHDTPARSDGGKVALEATGEESAKFEINVSASGPEQGSRIHQPHKVFTAADTFWRALFKGVAEQEALPQHPPTAYYWAPDEHSDP